MPLRMIRALILVGGLAVLATAEQAAVFTPERDASFIQFVSESIQHAQAQGGLRLYDSVLQKTWTLKLVQIRKETLVHDGARGFMVCAEFKPADGGADLLDINFDADWEETVWDMEKISIHKVNGEVRKGKR